MVDNGDLLAIDSGTATITARVSETIYAECSVVVVAPSHTLHSQLFSYDLTKSLVQQDGFVAAYGGLTLNNNGYLIENGTNGKTTTFFSVAGGEPLFGLNNSDLILKTKICSGNEQETLGNNVKVVLLDISGNEIEGTEQTIVSSLTVNPTVYSTTLPYNADAYGLKIKHLKTSGYTVRFYNVELNSKSINTYATLLATETVDGELLTLSGVKIKFGASITTDAWNEIISNHGTITDYGVMMFKQTQTPDKYSDTPVQDIFKQGKVLSNIHKGDGVPPTPDGDYYAFSANMRIPNETYYGMVFCAAPYIVAGGEYYFLGEMQFSVNTLAQYNQQNGGSNLSDAALMLLSGANN